MVRLGLFTDREGAEREVILLPGAEGSRLLVDRFAERGLDPRLVAHLAADEPIGNALLVCEEYLADLRPTCRVLRDEDLCEPPCPTQPAGYWGQSLGDGGSGSYRIGVAAGEARWLRQGRTLSVRQVVGALERYEPVRRMTVSAIDVLRAAPGVSVAALSSELRRLDQSPIVLNRMLRAAVLDAVSSKGLSLSRIAMRCGRFKADAHGRCSGETSWLARRVGLLAEGGRSEPTAWVHSDVLALIAREGLGLAPQDVEV
ncbi:MAG: hypothetical protein NVSMB51_05970 [Solirubrobacteraceae bacterium]